MATLITGAAGFIGYHLARALLARGEAVIGIDNLSPYYSVALKRARLADLAKIGAPFEFVELDLAGRMAAPALLQAGGDAGAVIHLAAQPGVRHALVDPHAYVEANVMGQLNVLEFMRARAAAKNPPKFVYASSSSVYGLDASLPFTVGDAVDTPLSLYAATKRADELMSETYCRLFGFAATGLRFFTVYGPWGRPDMATWLFTEAILAGKPIQLFDGGAMKRDFTYVDDAVAAVLAVLDARPPSPGANRLYNVGNEHAETVSHFVDVLERALGKKALRQQAPAQPGELKATWADISGINADTGWRPTTAIEQGLPRFVAWYRHYHNI